MKICLVGEFSGNLDEGMRNVSHQLLRNLSENNEILILDLKKISFSWINKIKEFKPEIIHYIHGPSINSLILLKIIGMISKTKTAASATQPRFNKFSKKLIHLFKPNLIFIQSYSSKTLFENEGCNVKFLPNGVDVQKFVPANQSKKKILRKKFSINDDKFVVLHVGSIKKKRNLKIFEQLQLIEGIQVVIVGSTSLSVEKDILNLLKKSGCIIINEFIENIEEVYQFSDCYVFPALDPKSCIETPLSVMEAMACNLFIISTKFGSLNDLFANAPHMFISDNLNDSEILEKVKYLKSSGIKPNTREIIIDYSWDNVVKKLESYYNSLQ